MSKSNIAVVAFHSATLFEESAPAGVAFHAGVATATASINKICAAPSFDSESATLLEHFDSLLSIGNFASTRLYYEHGSRHQWGPRDAPVGETFDLDFPDRVRLEARATIWMLPCRGIAALEILASQCCGLTERLKGRQEK